jgi:NAD(P)H-quinone oxidoreductase subunit 5
MQLSSIKPILLLIYLLTIIAFLNVVAYAYRGTHTIEIFSSLIADIKVGAGIRVDILSSLLFFMITILCSSIGHYSIRYLNGEQKQVYFYKYLLGIVLSASLLVLSSNLLMLFFMWLATSYNLHKLLIFYDHRPRALIAARKKAIVSRIGDAALLAGILSTYSIFQSFEFSDIFSQALNYTDGTNQNANLSIVGILFAICALTKSAQFPFHFWLPETMETPTPVSALMHAGVINAGGFLIIRLSPMFQYSNSAQILLILVGTISAVLGALCMIAQNDIKTKLAYSTISQMGMMMLACGLGLYSIALFHILAHSFYKAYAFLSTGKLVEESKKNELKSIKPRMLMIATVGLVALSAIIFSNLYLQGKYLPIVTYCSILLLGLFQSFELQQNSSYLPLKTIGKIMITMGLAITLYTAIELTLNMHFVDESPLLENTEFFTYESLALSLLSFLMFFGSHLLSVRLKNLNTPFLQRIYLNLKNGFYSEVRSTMFLSRVNFLPNLSKRNVDV